MAIHIQQNGQQLSLEGELNMQTVPEAAQQLSAHIQATTQHEVLLDFAAVRRSDSAGVALLVDVLQQARKAGVKVRFSHLPKQMQAIATISGLQDILPVSSD